MDQFRTGESRIITKIFHFTLTNLTPMATKGGEGEGGDGPALWVRN